jgi:hypothetical protein
MSLSPLRWGAFTRDQQLLMIANEMYRGARLFGLADGQRLQNSYERVLRLAELTIEVQPSPSLRRELRCWLELLRGLRLSPEPGLHRRLFRVFFQLTPATYRQLPFVLERGTAPGPQAK